MTSHVTGLRRGDGRDYTIASTATDSFGGIRTGRVSVDVPVQVSRRRGR